MKIRALSFEDAIKLIEVYSNHRGHEVTIRPDGEGLIQKYFEIDIKDLGVENGVLVPINTKGIAKDKCLCCQNNGVFGACEVRQTTGGYACNFMPKSGSVTVTV